jgi:hypothetical protein
MARTMRTDAPKIAAEQYQQAIDSFRSARDNAQADAVAGEMQSFTASLSPKPPLGDVSGASQTTRP